MATPTPITSIGSPDVLRNTKKVEAGDNGVEKEMFLKLMIAQLKNQDPTAPMDQKDMMASLTQFSQVEQMENMTKAMETLSLAQGVNMVGQYVDYRFQATNDDGSVSVDEIRGGKVVSVEQKAGSVQLVLANGVKVKPADVTSVSLEGRMPQTLMNKYVTYRYEGTKDGQPVILTLTGKVNQLAGTGADTKLVVGSHLVDPSKVIGVSNIPLTGYLENPPVGTVDA